jgi:hypothetical protein
MHLQRCLLNVRTYFAQMQRTEPLCGAALQNKKQFRATDTTYLIVMVLDITYRPVFI